MPLVQVRNVSKIYHLGGEEIRALDDVSVDIDAGEFISIIGPSGRTIALVTHDPEVAAFTPRRIEIRDGKIARNIDRKLAGLDRVPVAEGI